MSNQNIEEATEMMSPGDDFDRGKHKRHVTIRDEGYFSSSSTPKPARQGTSDSTEIELEKETEFSEVPNKIQLPDTNNVISTSNRPTWNKKADFLLSIIGFAVDLANVWRFPYLCYRNGGGVFLIPYTLMLIFGALPLFYMELVLGQYNRLGPISIWKICPLFKGVGYCAVLISWYVSFYYNVIICWALFFMISSISPQLPWIHCHNIWNTETCLESADVNDTLPANRTSPVVEFFEREVLELHLSEGIDDLGYPKWQLVLCLLAVFIIIYFALFKGVHSSGKVVWVTATAPYIILTILLLRGILLPGAREGVIYYISPDISKLSDSQVWIEAAVQVFFSVGVGFGVHLTYASYNTFRNNCFRDCIITTAVNSFTSLYSGFVIFVYLGYMANKHGVPINKVAADGHGLVFQVYPEALATLPGGSFWAVIFFFMLLTLGLDSAMGGLESVITGLMDEFREHLQWRFSRQIFAAFIISISFFIGIINVTRGGGYLIQWFDTYSAGVSLLCSALFEAIGVAWVYGLESFTANIQEMLGFKPGIFWRLCWKFISPFFLVAVIISALIDDTPLEYHDYRFPNWSVALGWGFGLSSVAVIPLVAIIKLLSTRGSCKKRLAYNITPEEEHKYLEDDKTVKRFQCKHWIHV